MKRATMLVLRDCTGCNAVRQIVGPVDRSAAAERAFTQQKNAQYQRYSRRASDLSREVKKFARHHRNSLSRELVPECSDRCGMHVLCFALPGPFLRRTEFNREMQMLASKKNAAKISGGNSRLPAKRRAKRTGIAEAYIESDPRYGQFTLA